jgi:hypothetical protein
MGWKALKILTYDPARHGGDTQLEDRIIPDPPFMKRDATINDLPDTATKRLARHSVAAQLTFKENELCSTNRARKQQTKKNENDTKPQMET